MQIEIGPLARWNDLTSGVEFNCALASRIRLLFEAVGTPRRKNSDHFRVLCVILHVVKSVAVAGSALSVRHSPGASHHHGGTQRSVRTANRETKSVVEQSQNIMNAAYGMTSAAVEWSQCLRRATLPRSRLGHSPITPSFEQLADQLT
jgi:hypothetical protein